MPAIAPAQASIRGQIFVDKGPSFRMTYILNGPLLSSHEISYCQPAQPLPRLPRGSRRTGACLFRSCAIRGRCAHRDATETESVTVRAFPGRCRSGAGAGHGDRCDEPTGHRLAKARLLTLRGRKATGNP